VEEEEKPKNFMVVPQIETTFAIGSAAEFAGSFGVAGFGIDARYLGLRPWRIGGSVSWQTITTRREDSVSSGDAVFTGTMIKELSYNPLLAKVGYTLSEGKKKVRTFAALGIGVSRSLRRVDTGIVSLFQEEWHFAMAPEAGVEIPVGPVHIVVTGRGAYLAPSGGLGDQLLFNLCAGVGFD